jgi:hypothetical protein
MSFLLIAYDLRQSGYNYSPFYSDMIAMGAKRLQASLWVVHTAEPAINICGRLWKKLDSERDRLLVAPVDTSQPYGSENEITRVQPIFWRRQWPT